MDAIDLITGKVYRVRWKQQSGNYRWYIKEATWSFLNYEKKQYGPDQLVWSGRPACGTQSMDVGNFLTAIEVHPQTMRTQPKHIGPIGSETL